MIRFLSLIYVLSFLACDHPESKEYNRFKEVSKSEETTNEANGYKVIGVKDGDTFVVLIDEKEQVIRLDHIDCPEKKQPFGQKAKKFASDLCFGKNVQLKHYNKYDKYKRLIAEVILNNGININKELVSNGLAWHFKKYSKDKDYADLELRARKIKLGLWADKEQIAPWEWRHK
jgi:micrococcal nuclease